MLYACNYLLVGARPSPPGEQGRVIALKPDYTITLNVEIGEKGKDRTEIVCSDRNMSKRLIINKLRDTADTLEYQDIMEQTLGRYEQVLAEGRVERRLRVVK